MSKIDEAKLNAAMRTIATTMQEIAQTTLTISGSARLCFKELNEILQTVETGTIPQSSYETRQPAVWRPAQGAKGPFEITNDMDSEEYRLLRAELEKHDRPIFHTFAGKNYRIWLMQDNQAIARRPLQTKGEGTK